MLWRRVVIAVVVVAVVFVVVRHVLVDDASGAPACAPWCAPACAPCELSAACAPCELAAPPVFDREAHCLRWELGLGGVGEHDMVVERVLLEGMPAQKIMTDGRSKWYANTVQREMNRDTYGLWRFEADVVDGPPAAMLPRSTLRTILDVGSNVGMFAVQAALRFPNATVYAIEPLEENYRRLEWNLCQAGLTNVVPLQFAVGNSSSWLKLEYLVSNPGGSRVPEGMRDGTRGEDKTVQHVVPQVSLDTLATITGVERFDFGKVDCEGCEMGIIDHFNPVQMLRSRFRFTGGEFHSAFFTRVRAYANVKKVFREAFPDQQDFYNDVGQKKK